MHVRQHGLSKARDEAIRFGIGFILLLWLGALPAMAQIARFQHVVVIIQENRSPDNLFQGLCTHADSCSTTPNPAQYNIQTSDWLNKDAARGVTQPVPVPLANKYDLNHDHSGFVAQCDRSSKAGPCVMDGSAGVGCAHRCPPNPAFGYVDNADRILDPYLVLARRYGWANYMFQTNQGPSLPAHQFLFGATSAPSASEDAAGTFISQNGAGGRTNANAGCASPPKVLIQLIDANGVEKRRNRIFPCAEHRTVADILYRRSLTWKYYAPGADTIWTAPNLIDHICVAVAQKCTGAAWKANVDLISSDVLRDIAHCRLRNMVWVVPTAANSDHAYYNNGGGPSWVASIVNAIGSSKCLDDSPKKPYWADTAVFILWDDWGGWYDHVAPPMLAYPEGGYQYGARVPFIAVSAYTPHGYIDNGRHDFGSIIRFIEHNFLVREGALNFADARSHTDLSKFFVLSKPPRPFESIPAPLNAEFFLNDKSPQGPPDND